MLDSLRADLTRTLAIVRRPTPEEQQEMMRRQMEETGDLEGEARLGESGGDTGADTPNPHLENKKKFAGIGRNDKCPCDSGKKFKHCHGRL
nr:SEC-C domain-containing protein [Pseudomonadota bacterium]